MGAIWTTDTETDRLKSVWSFAGGYNSLVPSVSISKEQSSDEEGWSSDRHPAIHTRRGRVRISNEAVRTSGVGQLLANYQHTHLVRAVDGVVQRYDPTTNAWVNMITGMNATAIMDSVNFEVDGFPALIVVNDIDPPKYWYPTGTGNLGGSPQAGRFITSDTVRVWLTEKDVMHFSARLNAEDWTTTKNSGFIQAFTLLGGGATGLTRYGGRTIIFKKDYMGEIHGTNYFEFGLMDVSNQIGCLSHISIAEVKGVLFWLGFKQVYVHQGGVPEPIGNQIKHFLDRVNWSKADRCFGGITDNDEYALGLVLDNDDYPSIILCFDLKTNIWRVNRKAQINSRSLLFGNQWYLMDRFGNVYKTEGYAENSQPIQSYIISPPFSEGMPEAEKEYFEMHVQGKLSANSSISIYASTTVDGNDFVLIDTVEGDAQTISTNHIIPLDTVNLCNWLRIKLVAMGEVEIYSVELYYNLLPVQH